MTELLSALRGHLGSRPSTPPAAIFVDSSDIRTLLLRFFILSNFHQPAAAKYPTSAPLGVRSDSRAEVTSSASAAIKVGELFSPDVISKRSIPNFLASSRAS